MGVVITRNLLAGKTTLDTLGARRRKVFVCMPGGSACKITVSEVLVEERLYSLGWKMNLRRMFQQPLFRDVNRYGFLLVSLRVILISLMVSGILTYGRK